MEQVAEVAAEMKELKLKDEALRSLLLEEMHKAGLKKEDTPYGKFTVKPYTKWLYSPKLVAKKEQIKIMELDEQRQGIAKAEVTESLSFTAVKIK